MLLSFLDLVLFVILDATKLHDIVLIVLLNGYYLDCLPTIVHAKKHVVMAAKFTSKRSGCDAIHVKTSMCRRVDFWNSLKCFSQIYELCVYNAT